MISDIKEDTNKQINEMRKSIHDLHKKSSNMDETFNKGLEIMNKIQVEMLVMKTSINQIKNTVERILRGQDQAEERISEREDKIKEVLHADKQ
jgi:signal transduction histidine kinase